MVDDRARDTRRVSEANVQRDSSRLHNTCWSACRLIGWRTTLPGAADEPASVRSMIFARWIFETGPLATKIAKATA
jgi:hypothetical protein